MRHGIVLMTALAVALLAGTHAYADDAGDDGGTEAGPTGPVSTVNSLAAGVAAKEGCSCVYVVQQSDAYCTNFANPTDYLAVRFKIDRATSGVSATFLDTTRTAHFTDGVGCTLDP